MKFQDYIKKYPYSKVHPEDYTRDKWYYFLEDKREMEELLKEEFKEQYQIDWGMYIFEKNVITAKDGIKRTFDEWRRLW